MCLDRDWWNASCISHFVRLRRQNSFQKNFYSYHPDTHPFGAGVKNISGKYFHVTRRAIHMEVNGKLCSWHFFSNPEEVSQMLTSPPFIEVGSINLTRITGILGYYSLFGIGIDEMLPAFHPAGAFGVKIRSWRIFRTEVSHEYLSAILLKKTNKMAER